MKSKSLLCLFSFLMFALTFSAYAGQTPAKPLIAVLNLEAKGINADEAALLTAAVEEAVFNAKAYELVTRLKIDAAWSKIRALYGGVCGEECAAQLGKDVAAHNVIFGSIGALGGVYQVQLKLVDVASGKVANMKSLRVETPLGRLPDHIGKLVGELLAAAPAPLASPAGLEKKETAAQASGAALKPALAAAEPGKAAAVAQASAPSLKPGDVMFVLPPDTGKISKGTGDGQFDSPCGVALDDMGNIYVADTLNGRIQVFSQDGVFLRKWSVVASGAGKFLPRKLAVDSAGNVFVTDEYSNSVFKFSSGGALLKTWGGLGSAPGQFNHPRGIAVGKTGFVFVVDMDNHRVQRFNTEGAFKGAWGELGSRDGQFASPHDIALDNWGFVYVTDGGNCRIQKFNTIGGFEEAWGTSGSELGMFRDPDGIAADEQKKIYVADTGNNWIQKFSNAASFLKYYGSKGTAAGRFGGPKGVAVDAAGSFMVIADTNNHRIQKINLK